ncbi:PAS domain-containing sensor histidine kinase [Elstera cyanobacteriorum]|uniref:histidine kinase n=1 Tax=Elstera cyanobacteriorum TaxID=2022747 RepID=A0A255XNW6_9PROT|nr:ATP-binding protein [Elstera cyanobacteriorum]OYQ18602.1 two-component sensor histidine kinase [Elstera cyanobacteriorum]GFZ79144.1 PAS domain-containing sensor histidine kinase [Elstera cyanobacteriorum]
MTGLSKGPRQGRVTKPHPIEEHILINALPYVMIALDEDNCIRLLNIAAEQFLGVSSAQAVGGHLSEYLAGDSPLTALVELCRNKGRSLVEHGVLLEGPRLAAKRVTVDVTPVIERPGTLLIALREHSIASKIDQQMSSRGAARSVTAMAAMLAHEVKNPLSGIRGAAQLLETSASPDDQMLTRLIVDEVDRIKALVNRMEVFSDSRALQREPVNIHQVLDHVRKLAQSGFARDHRFIELYDPSLPPVYGNRDLLVQVFLNLVKNAAEAMPHPGGEITLKTAYQHGVRLEVPGAKTRVHLPLVVTVQDNGEGIPDDLQPHLFDAFVTTKTNGSGLGLALVAKIIGDHGGVVEVDSQPKRTSFRVYLPMVPTR